MKCCRARKVLPWPELNVRYHMRTHYGSRAYVLLMERACARGAPTPDRRVLSDGIHSTARPVKGLPIHAYDAKWYSELSELEKDNIHAVQEPYNFTHDEGLLQ